MVNTAISYAIFFVLLFRDVVSQTKGSLMLIGGALQEDNADILDRLVQMAGGRGSARFACITTASEDPEGSGKYYEDLFSRYGAQQATWIPVTETNGNANNNEVIEMLQNMTGFFFGGGDQARIVRGWVDELGSDTKGLSVIRDKFQNGAIIAGTSAGSACQTVGPMATGGTSWNGLKDGASLADYDDHLPDELIYGSHGIGFVPDYIIDSHFSQRGREGRLVELLLDTDVLYGLGIDENTAALISPDNDMEVISNEGGVVFINITSAKRSSQSPTSVDDVEFSYFTKENVFNMKTGELNLPTTKINISGNESLNEIEGSSNIFSSLNAEVEEKSVFRETAQKFWNSKMLTLVSSTYEENPKFTITMRKDVGIGLTGNPLITYHKMKVDIKSA